MSDWLDVRKPRLIGFPTPSKNSYAYQRGVSLVRAELTHSIGHETTISDFRQTLRILNKLWPDVADEKAHTYVKAHISHLTGHKD